MISRRTVLRGLGVALALPWLERMSARATASSPRRLIVWHVPNGMPMHAWTPGGDGLAWTASPVLAPLDAWRDQVSILSGLDNADVPVIEPHHARALGLLSGRRTLPWEAEDPAAWRTVDQLAADALSGTTAIRSLELGGEAATPCGEAAAGQVPSCAGYHTISWDGAQRPLPREVTPRRVFERLVGRPMAADLAARQRARDVLVVDAVREDAGRLRGQLGRADQSRLDQYLTGIDEVERRLQALPPAPDGVCGTEAAALEASGLLDAPLDRTGQVDLMNELIVLALQCDRTRVVSYMLGNERSARAHPQIGISGGHHDLSHHSNVPVRLDALVSIGRWEVERFAGLLERLDAVQEPDGTLLHQSAVLLCGAMSDPDRHDRRDLPVVLAGRAGGALTPAGHLRLAEGTPLANLHLTVLRRLGVDIDRVGEEGEAEISGV